MSISGGDGTVAHGAEINSENGRMQEKQVEVPREGDYRALNMFDEMPTPIVS
ncbi:hypothetical protein U1Q18_031128, partial [Sarracenia purpurea var. burkii]